MTLLCTVNVLRTNMQSAIIVFSIRVAFGIVAAEYGAITHHEISLYSDRERLAVETRLFSRETKLLCYNSSDFKYLVFYCKCLIY